MAITIPPPPSPATIRLPEFESREAEEAVCEALGFLCSSWGMSGSKLADILRLSQSTINHWLREGRVPIGKPPFDSNVEAIIHLIAIHKSLHAMFSKPTNQMTWLKTPHPELHRVPLELMQESTVGLIAVRQHLDYVRGRGA